MASRLPQGPLWTSADHLRDAARSWRPTNWRLMLWHLFWFPYWFLSDVPRPWLPARMPVPAPAASDASAETIRAIDSIGRRVWINNIIALVVRGIWLTFVIASAAGVVALLQGDDWTPRGILWICAVTVPLGVVLGLLLRPGTWRTAWMLDHTFNLNDRMTTAVEASDIVSPIHGTRGSLTYLQVADAANAASSLRNDPRFRLHLPSREIVLAILSGLVMLALLFLRGVGGSVAPLDNTQIAAFVPAAERRIAAASTDAGDNTERAPTVAEVQTKAERSGSVREDLNTLADALAANALTQPAADAIRNGDYATAAQTLRDIAQQADALSPDSRTDLADALDDAAAATADSSPSLSNAASEASDGLREGGTEAENGVRDLGDAVDLAGQSVVPQDQLASEMAAAQSSAANQQQGSDAAANSQNGNQSSSSQGGTSSQGGGDQGLSDPAGADAAAGQGSEQSGDTPPGSEQSSTSDETSSSQSDSASQPGAAQSDSAGETAPSAGSNGAPGQPGNAANPGNASGPGEGDGPQSINDANGQGNRTANQLPGGGAGGEQVGSNETAEDGSSSSSGGDGSGTNESAAPTAGAVSTQPVTSGAGTTPTVVPNQSVTLDNSGGGESIQLGGGGSTSSLGSGSGVMVASGDAVQSAVPTAAPEANNVPAEYRDVVEQYFSRDGT